MPYYETLFLTRQDLSSSQNENLAKDLQQIIESNDGEIARTEFWGLRNLTYRINKNRKAHYILFNMEASHDAMQRMEEELRYNDNVLRFMTLRTEDLPTEESIAVQDNDRAESIADSITEEEEEGTNTEAPAEEAETEEESAEEAEAKATDNEAGDDTDKDDQEEGE